MATVVDPRNVPDSKIFISGLKPPVREFAPSDDSNPTEADAVNRMIRELRNQSPASTDKREELALPPARCEKKA
jgi:hypothetical protein